MSPFNNYLNTGGRYNPATNSWTATSTNNPPDGREYATAVWTGSEMIVWGGQSIGKILPEHRWKIQSKHRQLDSSYYHECADRPIPSHGSMDRKRDDCVGWIFRAGAKQSKHGRQIQSEP